MEHPGDTSVDVALTCVLNGYIDNPTFYGWGGVVTDHYASIDVCFTESLTRHGD